MEKKKIWKYFDTADESTLLDDQYRVILGAFISDAVKYFI